MPDTSDFSLSHQVSNYQTFDPMICSKNVSSPVTNEATADLNPSSGIKLKKQLGAYEGVALIAGSVIGSGIFVSPRGGMQSLMIECRDHVNSDSDSASQVLKEAGSAGLSIVVWIACGCMTTIGALCYAELGTSIPRSGGDYAYIKEAFGSVPAFLFLYVALFIVIPAWNAVGSLTFALYIMAPFFPECQSPRLAIQLIASSAICLLTFINCYNVKWAAYVQNIFTSAKIFALAIIIVTGLYALFFPPEAVSSFDKVWANTSSSPARIALSFYSGLFSYSGWNYLNFVTEELHDPHTNLPKAIYIALPTVSIIYVLANVAYFAVLSPEEILLSPTVAVAFGNRVLGPQLGSWLMSLAVALSTFGGLNGAIFASSRLLFVGARSGHMPSFFTMINVHYISPMPSLILVSFVTLFYSFFPDIYDLINYTAFSEAIFVTICVAALLWLRYARPEMDRPIRVPIVLPILFMVICLFLVTFPIFASPNETGISLLITLSGIPLYYATVHWDPKPRLYKQAISSLTRFLQRFLLSVEEGEETEKTA